MDRHSLLQAAISGGSSGHPPEHRHHFDLHSLRPALQAVGVFEFTVPLECLE